VPEAIRSLAKTERKSEYDKKEKSLDFPVINIRSLTATPKGLFFASSGYGYGHWGNGDQALGGEPAPVLLYITWDEINTWLAKNAPEAGKPALETSKPASP